MKEEVIRPKNANSLFLKKCIQDCNFFFRGQKRIKIKCYACNKNSLAKVFVKYRFEYQKCKYCNSLFHSPRYNFSAFQEYYKNSKSWNYWASIYFPKIEKARQKVLIRPKINKINALLLKTKIFSRSIIDVGAGAGNFLEEWKKKFKEKNILAIEPSKVLAQKCVNKNIPTINLPIEKVMRIRNKPSLITCFEVIEHVENPIKFVKKIKNLCKKQTCVLFTTLTIDGFDLSLLYKKSDSIFPPHHINIFSLYGLKKLFSLCGFKIISVLTPGKLDTEIVKNNMHRLMLPSYIKTFLTKLLNDENKFQKFLEKNLLSSHVWILVQKK